MPDKIFDNNEEMADLILEVLEDAETRYGYDFGAAVVIENGEDEEQVNVSITMNRQRSWKDWVHSYGN